MENGIRFQVLYIGCIGISKSMRELEFDHRSAITKECITRVAETANRITSKKRKEKLNKNITDAIQGKTELKYAGSNVDLLISTSKWIVSKTGTNETLFLHQMPTISFASAGDGFTADFVGYVAKTEIDRRCYVFECSAGVAQQVIAAIGEAFKMRFERFTQSTMSPHHHIHDIRTNGRPINGANHHSNGVDLTAFGSPVSPTSTLTRHPPMSMSPPAANAVPVVEADHPSSPRSFTSHHRYQNESVARANGTAAYNSFDPTTSVPTNYDLLIQERWFHGQLNRENSELIVKTNGDFLVRQSDKNPSQFVLTGMQDGVHKHLLLIDEEGKVRTKDREFNDICHLIKHHRENSIPITSAESSLMLRSPILRQSSPKI